MPDQTIQAMSQDALVLVDCTLRDGGFHTAWDFEPALVAAYLRAVDEAGVDFAEIGYRSLARDGFAGALRYSDEELVRSLPELSHTRLAVMVDAKEFAGREPLLTKLFAPADASRIALVRVAARPKEVPTALLQIAQLRALGYETALNIMTWATVPVAERAPLLVKILQSDVDVVYLADSYGSMHPDEVEASGRLVTELAATLVSKRHGRPKPWGIHLHNNLELAFANALAARKSGATWIDVSVTGMGRGPGNLKTELFLQHLEMRERHPRYRTAPVYELIGSRMEELQARYRWGPSAAYVLSGHLAVHPAYAQELLESQRYTIPEVTAILHALHAAGTGGSYSKKTLDEAISARPTTIPTRRGDRPGRASAARGTLTAKLPRLSEWRGQDWSSREVLVVGRGQSGRTHADALNRWIRRFRPIVLECNHRPFIAPTEDQLSAFIVLANAKAMLGEALAAGKAVLFGAARGAAVTLEAPHADDEHVLERSDGTVSEAQPPRERAQHASPGIYVEPYSVEGGTLSLDPCVLPADVVSMFAIVQAMRLGAKRITVAGFDGYQGLVTERERRMQAELDAFFDLLGARYPETEIVSLTPTGFAIRARSVYGELAVSALDG